MKYTMDCPAACGFVASVEAMDDDTAVQMLVGAVTAHTGSAHPEWKAGEDFAQQVRAQMKKDEGQAAPAGDMAAAAAAPAAPMGGDMGSPQAPAPSAGGDMNQPAAPAGNGGDPTGGMTAPEAPQI